MLKTRIEWCDATWNPVTGCRHKCPYCYARRMAQRFAGYDPCYSAGVTFRSGNYDLAENERKYKFISGGDGKPGKKAAAPYPFGFMPTMHRYRLSQPQKWKDSQTIFVCSMADLFGEWVPDEWIDTVMDACREASMHRYLFLTKNPERYVKYGVPCDENKWYGTSVTTEADMQRLNYLPAGCNVFVSIEPLLGDLYPEKHNANFRYLGWLILGAESGRRRVKVTPQVEWIEKIVQQAKRANVPVFMKDSLVPIMGEANMIREFPWRPRAEKQETADIIRCRDCKHYGEVGNCAVHLYDGRFNRDYFCADAERASLGEQLNEKFYEE